MSWKGYLPGIFVLAVAGQFAFSPPTQAQTTPVCSSVAADADGDGFGFENNASCVVTDESAGPPEFVNQVTSEPVVLVRAYWDGLTDFSRPIICTRYFFGSDSYSPSRSATVDFDPLPESAPFEALASVNGGAQSRTWGVDNGIYSGPTNLGMSPWFEIVTVEGSTQQAVRTWFSDTTYNQCETQDSNFSFVPTGTPPGVVTDAGECDYSDAAMFDGWGWNPTTGQSCPPLDDGGEEPTMTSGCDYSNAAANDGWGWDESTAQSCPPLDTTPQVPSTEEPTMADGCDYSNASVNGGFGWDASTGQSCPPLDTAPENTPMADGCDYSNAAANDGWGWDASTGQSCSPISDDNSDAMASCDYTDAASNGGWGWDNVALQSCPPIASKS